MSSRARPTTNVVAPPTRFVGRAAEADALRRTLEHERLVTILGPPGTGKTRLAIEVAQRCLPDFAPGGVWLCDLADVTDVDGACAVVARTLAVALTSGATGPGLPTQLGWFLETQGRLLLVLDNFEHLVVHAAQTVGTWLKLAPEATVLVASRQRLGLTGEALFDLPPLGLPAADDLPTLREAEAVQLFVERTRSVRGASWELGETDAPAVAELVRRLDGLPLAIELAAARMRVLSPAQILANLPRRFQLLRDDRAGGARGATLWGALEWSWSMLDEVEREVLAQCSVFRGGFDLAAAEAVVVPPPTPGPKPWMLDLLQSLRDKSLLVTTDGPRGQQRFALYASVRAHAATKLTESGLEAKAMWRHASHYLALGGALARRVDATDGSEALEELGAELENLAAVFRRAMEDTAVTGPFVVGAAGPTLPAERAEQALRAALALGAYHALRGPFGPWLEWIDAALGATAPKGVDQALLVRALDARARARRLLGRTADSLADAERALAIAERLRDPGLLALVLGSIGWLELIRGAPAKARATYERALDALRTATPPHRKAEGRCLAALGDTSFWLADAREPYERALAIHREVGDRRAEGFTRCRLGATATQDRRYGEAKEELEAALAIGREVGDRRCEAVALGCLGLLALDLGRIDEAAERLDASLRLHRTIENRWFEGIFVGYLGALRLEEGRNADARALLEEALRIHRDVGWVLYEGVFLGCLGAAYAMSGDAALAGDALRRAQERLAELGRPELSMAASVHSGHRALPGDVAAARACIERAATYAGSSLDVRLAVRLLDQAIAQAESASTPRPITGETTAATALRVCESGRWFQLAGGERVSLQRRRALHLIVKALADTRGASPGRALGVDALLAHGWPGERVMPEAGADRVYMALSTLRKLGLRDVLLSRDDGYLLDPRVAIVRVAEPG